MLCVLRFTKAAFVSRPSRSGHRPAERGRSHTADTIENRCPTVEPDGQSPVYSPFIAPWIKPPAMPPAVRRMAAIRLKMLRTRPGWSGSRETNA